MNQKFINFCIQNAQKFAEVVKKDEKEIEEILFFVKIRTILAYRVLHYNLYFSSKKNFDIARLGHFYNPKYLKYFLEEQAIYFYKFKKDMYIFFKELIVINNHIKDKEIIKDALYCLFYINSRHKIYTIRGKNYRILRSWKQKENKQYNTTTYLLN